MGSTLSIESARSIINHWHSESTLIFNSGSHEIAKYFQAVDKIQQSVPPGDKLISKAVARLKHEFQSVLDRHSDPHTAPTSLSELSTIMYSTGSGIRYEDYVTYELPCNEVNDYLRNIVQRMNSLGHIGECFEAYKRKRKLIMEATFKRIKLDEFITSDAKRIFLEEEEMKMKIDRWVQAAKVCSGIIFAREKQLYGLIFLSVGNDEHFLKVVKDAAISLFTFPEAVSKSQPTYERMERILILYDALSSLVRDTETLFLSESARDLRTRISRIKSTLGNEVRRMLSDFEDAVRRDIRTISDAAGQPVHPLTKTVTDFLNVLVNYKDALNGLIVSKPNDIESFEIPKKVIQEAERRSVFSLHLILIIAVLQFNLVHKSKECGDTSVGHRFMMNNVRYIVQKMEESQESRGMIGARYLKKLTEDVERAKSNYENTTHDRFSRCLSDEGLYVTRCFSSSVSASALRKRFDRFNSVFEEVRQFQSLSMIPDSQLCKELQHTLMQKLIPTYQHFLEKHAKHCQKIPVKYSVQDLEALRDGQLDSRSD